MAQTNDLTPPIDSSVELLTLAFDFGLVFGAGETILSVVSLTCSNYIGVDPSPSSRLIGSPVIIASPKTGVMNGAVAQQVGSMIAGVTYRLQCVISTTATPSNILSLWAHFACVQPT